MSRKIRRTAYYAAVIAFAAAVAVFSPEMSEAAESGLSLCLRVIIPALFPFYAASSLMIRTGAAEALGRRLSPLMRPLFGVSGACSAALLLGLCGGYPVGARTAAALYSRGEISRAEAEKLLSFCNNSGPSFILGIAGTVFGSTRTGYILLAVHIFSALLTGVLLRGRSAPAECSSIRAEKRECFASALVGSVGTSFSGMLPVCGFVVFFFAVLRLFALTGIKSAAVSLLSSAGLGAEAEGVFAGLFELSAGITALSGDTSPLCTAAAAFLLGWGGFSVHLQTLAVLAEAKLPPRRYFTGKLLHGTLSAAVMLAVFPFASGRRTPSPFGISAAMCAICAVLLFVSLFFLPKRAGKAQKKHL